jgi:predicted CopG family antitoxin
MGVCVHRKLTITVSDDVYQGLQRKVGRGQISGFIEDLVRPHVVDTDQLEAAYREMAADEEREREATEWIEAESGEALP